ncbi:hypothetical protein BD626DRAFT_500461 [Schizophyllum amplum]|uniref:RING-type domain-containing protein n=1 Tax=Schizophyllum amplum TaxID=97359 RepID=A0A550CAD9_9AGAR|nr:hypothetical protein BD626DRAFT_500461 [Auriculariopsis ampla]
MGNSSSSANHRHQDDTVDLGFLTPQGVYTGPRDWNQAIVSQFICARKLAPFYRPLEDYEEDWDDETILQHRKQPPQNADMLPDANTAFRVESSVSSSSIKSSKRPPLTKESAKNEAAIYRGAVECPICFLYYPPNINHSRCCDQAICTECFVQIKRAEPTTTHCVSEPAACPYCVQDNFGVVYSPPPWRTGLASEGAPSPFSDSPKGSQQSINTSAPQRHKRRQKSFSADSPEVVTTDQIRPDWEQKLAAVRAAVARRANRRIIMRQVGDRLIPVGVSSGRVHALSPEEAANAQDGEPDSGSGSRRSRRRQNQGGSAFEQFVGMGGQDLEELMLMEAMRLSSIQFEEEERKRKAEEEKKKKKDKKKNKDKGGSPSPSAARSSRDGPPSAESASLAAAPQRASTSSTASSQVATPSLSVAAPGSSPAQLRSSSPSPPVVQQLSSNAPLAPTLPTPTQPFSTLNVAMSSAATASALLASPPDGDAPSGEATPADQPAQTTVDLSEDIPSPAPATVVSTSDDQPPSPDVPSTPTASSAPQQGTSATPIEAGTSTSDAVSVGGPALSGSPADGPYVALPSTPVIDDDQVREPLLRAAPDGEGTSVKGSIESSSVLDSVPSLVSEGKSAA